MRRRSGRRALALLCSALLGSALGWRGRRSPIRRGTHASRSPIGRICDLIEAHADRNGLPRDFFARLIWKESRFDPNAVSPAGAEGIAQFMPGTATMRGLANSFDIEQAIPASAKYLGELKTGFGNLGLAAAAYNAGESRVSRWLSSGGFLPLETENYVLDIMGEPADNFTDAAYAGTVQPLDPKLNFGDACRKLPVIMSRPCHGDASTSSHGACRWPAISAAPRRSANGSACSGRFPALLGDTSRWSAGCARRSAAAASMPCASAPTTAPTPTSSARNCAAPAAPASW